MSRVGRRRTTELVAVRGDALSRYAYLLTGSVDDAADSTKDALCAQLAPRVRGLTLREPGLRAPGDPECGDRPVAARRRPGACGTSRSSPRRRRRPRRGRRRAHRPRRPVAAAGARRAACIVRAWATSRSTASAVLGSLGRGKAVPERRVAGAVLRDRSGGRALGADGRRSCRDLNGTRRRSHAS